MASHRSAFCLAVQFERLKAEKEIPSDSHHTFAFPQEGGKTGTEISVA
jgi:hypothetical protein